MFFFASMNSRNKIQKLQKDLNDLEKPAGEKFFFRHFLLHERQKKKKKITLVQKFVIIVYNINRFSKKNYNLSIHFYKYLH